MQSEATSNLLLSEVENENSELANEFFSSLKQRLSDRRSSTFVSLMLYLANAENLNKKSYSSLASIREINQLAVELMQRLFEEEDRDLEEVYETESISSTTSSESFTDKLQKFVNEYNLPDASHHSSSINFKKEMQNYAKFKIRSPTLDKLFSALMTIQGTSVAAERNFSESSNVITKFRSKLSDENIDAIIFLKYYFRSKV